DTLVRSIARRCRIQRLQRRVVLARSSANAGIRCWKILVAHSVLSQVKRGTRTCSLVGCPTIGRSVSFRWTWSRRRPAIPHPAQIGSRVTGAQNRCVSSSATAASALVPPSSTVRQMVSASRLAVAFKAGPGVFDAWRENLHLHTPQDPYILCLTASPANPSYALRIRKSHLSAGSEMDRRRFVTLLAAGT